MPDLEWRKKLGDVFTPSKPAVGNYVPRGKEDTDFESALSESGLQVILYGSTGVGKTSLALAKLEGTGNNYHRFALDDSINESNLFPKVLQQLGFEKKVQKMKGEEMESHAEVIGEGRIWLLAKFGGKVGIRGKGNTTNVTVPYFSDGDVDAVVTALTETDCILFFDDVEKARNDDVRKLLAHLGKKMSDITAMKKTDAKIVYAGVSQEVSKLIAVDPSLRARLAEQLLNPLSNEEILEILTSGWKALGLDYSDLDLAEIAEMCCGLARYAHWIGKQAALAADEEDRRTLKEQDVEMAYRFVITKYRDDYQNRLDLATGHREGLRFRERVLRAMAHSEEIEVPFDYILEEVSEMCGFPQLRTSLSGPIGELKQERRGRVIEDGRTNGHHRFTDMMLKPYIRMLELTGAFPNG